MLNGEIKLQPNNSSLTKELHGWVVYATASKVLNYDWNFSEFDPQWWYFYLSALVPKQRNRTELSWKADAKRNEKTFQSLRLSQKAKIITNKEATLPKDMAFLLISQKRVEKIISRSNYPLVFGERMKKPFYLPTYPLSLSLSLSFKTIKAKNPFQDNFFGAVLFAAKTVSSRKTKIHKY